MKLVHKSTGVEVQLGEQVESREEVYTLSGWAKPHKPSSSGRVHVKDCEGHEHEYFPHVFGLEWQAGE